MKDKTSENIKTIKTSEKQKIEKKGCNEDFWCKFVVGTKIAVIIALSAFLVMKYLEHRCQECKKQMINNEKTK